MYCFLNGEIILKKEAKISILDIGLLRGYGIYEAMPAFGSKILRFEDHWNRFVKSAQALNLNIPITQEKAEKVIQELIAKNHPDKRSNIKFILTGGETLHGIEYDFSNPTFSIFTEEQEPLPKELYEKGAKLVTYHHARQMPGHKTTDYIAGVNLQSWRKEEGALEILYVHDGEVFECATSNIFLVKNNIIITPAEDILGGITRKIVLELAREAGQAVEERRLEESELAAADEIFITSSFKDVVPVTKIDDFVIGSGEVGPITKALMAKFADCTK